MMAVNGKTLTVVVQMVMMKSLNMSLGATIVVVMIRTFKIFKEEVTMRTSGMMQTRMIVTEIL